MLDIADILDDPDFTLEIEIERRKESVDQHGRGAISTMREIISACVQSATAKELERLPEMDRERETLVVYSKSDFHTRQDADAPDVIFWHGQAYEVCAVERWPGWQKALVQLLPEDEFDQ